jgi:sulfur carrier protein
MIVNGTQIALQDAVSLQAFLQAQSYNLETVVVEHDGKIITKERFAEVLLKNEDTLEIVCFVGGG